jgi:predicted transcriptional regulator
MNKTKTLKQVTDSEFLTVEESANELGIKPTAIRNYLCDGKLTTYKFKTMTLLDKKEIENWKQRQK